MIHGLRLKERVLRVNVRGRNTTRSSNTRCLHKSSMHNDTFDDGRDEVGRRSYGQPIPEGLHGEDLNDEVDTDLQAPRREEPSNSSVCSFHFPILCSLHLIVTCSHL